MSLVSFLSVFLRQIREIDFTSSTTFKHVLTSLSKLSIRKYELGNLAVAMFVSLLYSCFCLNLSVDN